LIIDSHMHAGALGFPFDLDYSIEDLARNFAQQGLAAGIVFCHDNDLTPQVLDRIPNAAALYWVHPRERGWLAATEKFLDANPERVRGVKLHSLMDTFHPADPMLDPLMDMLAERRLVALFHTGHAVTSEPMQLFPLIDRHQDVDVVLGHMGGQNIFYIEDALYLAKRFERVWLETSAMPMHDVVRRAQLATGRVLYGTDATCHPWQAQRPVIEEAGLDEQNLAAVLGGNAERLFFPKGLPR
jgi:uncharacterized protein